MYIKVHVHTGAKKESLTELSQDHFAVSVKQKPLQNLANRRVVELIAAHLHIPAKSVRIVSGHHAPSKILSVL